MFPREDIFAASGFGLEQVFPGIVFRELHKHYECQSSK